MALYEIIDMEIETELNISLQSWYKEFIESYPKELEELCYDYDWKKEYVYERELLKNKEALLDINNNLRTDDGTPWINGGPWPNHYFVIGDDECGNYWFIDTQKQDKSIWFYDHDFGKTSIDHKDINDFINLLKQQYAKSV